MRAAQTRRADQVRFGPIQIAIILLTLATAAIHISLLFPDPLFILNGLGYLTLLALFFLPIPFAQKNHNLIRWLLIGYAALTIILWAVMNYPNGYTTLGWVTKAIEVVLIALLFIEGRQ